MKQARERAGLSLADVARRYGIDTAALSRLENGLNPNPTLDTLWRYAAAVGKRVQLNAEDIASTRNADGRRPTQKRLKVAQGRRN